MLKVKMKTTSASPNGLIVSGQVIELDDKQAKELVTGGYAEYIEPPKETTTQKPRQTATTKTTKEKATKKPTTRRKKSDQ